MSDDWSTPAWLYRMFHTYYDPCPLGGHITNKDNPEEGIWEPMYHYNGIYVNPPYSNPLPWVRKAIRSHVHTKLPVVLLLKHDSSTKWYAELKEAGARFLMIEGRLKYGDAKTGAAFPSVLAVL